MEGGAEEKEGAEGKEREEEELAAVALRRRRRPMIGRERVAWPWLELPLGAGEWLACVRAHKRDGPCCGPRHDALACVVDARRAAVRGQPTARALPGRETGARL